MSDMKIISSSTDTLLDKILALIGGTSASYTASTSGSMIIDLDEIDMMDEPLDDEELSPKDKFFQILEEAGHDVSELKTKAYIHFIA